ncbi:hypothetical protein [Janibacter sp. YB324]|nr:hypothetical protein [Janibacter sp. YB324]QNF95630.1 hypothetical protein H7A72_07865 [Janibacter sp. YB324]
MQWHAGGRRRRRDLGPRQPRDEGQDVAGGDECQLGREVVGDVQPHLAAFRAGRLDEARSINDELMPRALGLMRPRPGAATAKAALAPAGVISSAAARLPMVEEPPPGAVHQWLTARHSPAA